MINKKTSGDFIIYKVTNIVNGKSYIGKSSFSLEKRRKEHYTDSKRNNGKTVFHKSLCKYPKDCFIWDIIYTCEDILILNVMETFKIMVNHSHVSEGGYNLTWGGDGVLKGFKHTEKQCKEKSIRQKGENNPFYGKHHTEKTKELLRNINKLYKHTEDAKRKIKENHTGMLNKHHSDETKRKIQIKKLGTKHSEETKQKMSESHRKHPIEIINEAKNLRESGLSWVKISKNIKISDSTIRRWCKNIQKGGIIKKCIIK